MPAGIRTWLFPGELPEGHTAYRPGRGSPGHLERIFLAVSSILNPENVKTVFQFDNRPIDGVNRTTQFPLPGLSIFHLGPHCKGTGAAPWLRGERPWLQGWCSLNACNNLKAPFSEGYARTGLPPIISSMYFTVSLHNNLILTFHPSWGPLRTFQSQSQPSSFSCLACPEDFWVLSVTPSTMARGGSAAGCCLFQLLSRSRCEHPNLICWFTRHLHGYVPCCKRAPRLVLVSTGGS